MNFFELYHRLAKITIISICLVICAGGFVRMTGSGMGCPDWPKCFGYWIPPTHISQLPEDYKEIYSNRGYDKLDFNVFNTWTEYINRLLGFIAGIFCVCLLFFAVLTTNITLIFFSFFLVLMMGLQAWMGALVVYSVLAPFKITIHMLIALFILSLAMLVHRMTSINNVVFLNTNFKWACFAIIISIIQIIIGTQVREEVDELLYTVSRSDIIMNLPFIFEVHRIIAWLVLGSNALLLYHYRTVFKSHFEFKAIIVIISLLCITGILMSYHSVEGVYQLFHLVFAVALFLCQFSILLKRWSLSIVGSP